MGDTNWIGANGRFGIGRETRGVAWPPPAVPAYGMEFLGITNRGGSYPDAQVDWREYPTFTTSHGREPFKLIAGKVNRPGNQPFLPVNPKFLYYSTGTYTFRAGGGPHGMNQHIFELQRKPTLPTFTGGVYFEGAPSFQRRFKGCMVNTQALTISEGNELQASWGYFGGRVLDHDIDNPQGAQVINDPTPFGQTDPLMTDPYMFYDTDANVGLAGAFDLTSYTWGFGSQGRRIARVKNVNVSHNNGVHPNHYFGTGAGDISPRGAREAFGYTTGKSSRSLSLTMVPTGALKSQNGDTIYDLLQGLIKGDVIIPFRRYSKDTNQFIDSMDIVLLDAGISGAPHDRPESLDEMVVTASMAARRILFVAENAQGDYQLPN